jgi:hypothetical protein
VLENPIYYLDSREMNSIWNRSPPLVLSLPPKVYKSMEKQLKVPIILLVPTSILYYYLRQLKFGIRPVRKDIAQ